MDRSQLCYLIKKTWTMDALNQQTATEEERAVFVNVQSVSQTEWFNGGQNGLKPEWKVTMFAPDYEDEDEIELFGKRWTIYRTYLRADELLELYVEKRTSNGEN